MRIINSPLLFWSAGQIVRRDFASRTNRNKIWLKQEAPLPPHPTRNFEHEEKIARIQANGTIIGGLLQAGGVVVAATFAGLITLYLNSEDKKAEAKLDQANQDLQSSVEKANSLERNNESLNAKLKESQEIIRQQNEEISKLTEKGKGRTFIRSLW